jgi:cAMP-dependent protein kinase regulator
MENFESGEIIIHQGDVGEYFYLVESGHAEVIVNGRGVVNNYKSGDYFGGTSHYLDRGEADSVQS